MGRLTWEEKAVIAYNISEQRKMQYPGHGGGKKCAQAFGTTPDRWSPWESGNRTPDDDNLAQIASFFKVTVADLRRKPEDWEKAYPAWMATKRRSRKRDLHMESLQQPQPPPAAAPAAPGDGGNTLALLAVLGANHGKIASGEISAADYEGKVGQIVGFAKCLFGA